jgi:hypothetical protein
MDPLAVTVMEPVALTADEIVQVLSDTVALPCPFQLDRPAQLPL